MKCVGYHSSHKKLFRWLLQRFVSLSGTIPPPMDHINALLRPLFDLATAMDTFAGEVARDYLAGMHKSLVKKSAEGSPSMPSPRGLFFLQLLSHIFPVTDFVHIVTTPAQLLMGQFLAQSLIVAPRDIAAGLMICNIFLHVHVLAFDNDLH